VRAIPRINARAQSWCCGALLRALTIALVAVFGLLSRPASAGNNPNLLWQSIETPHFRITFYSGMRDLAEHVADIAEGAVEELGPELGWTPTQRTEVLLVDYYESANGSATGLPYNAIRLYVTAPDDLSPLSDTDDWQLELVTHELTHVVHMDQARGLPPLVNAILGRTWLPNQVQPRWLLEGLAVIEESKFTSAGRMRSSLWDMQMRTDVLEDNVAYLDRLSNTPRRWPQGNIWYLYGSYFLQYVIDVYGPVAIRDMIRHYASQPVPWGINRAIRKATGKTFEELYDAWVKSLQVRYQAQKSAIAAKGIREGKRLTFQGQSAAFPRWVPKPLVGQESTGSFEQRQSQGQRLIYYRNDGHSRGGEYEIPVKHNAKGGIAGGGEARMLFRTSGDTPVAFTPEGDMVFSSQDVYESIFSFNDLQRYSASTIDENGQGGTRVRLTEGFRAAEPAVSPDGHKIVFVTNHRGTRTLQIADLEATTLRNVRPLHSSMAFEQVFAPRFSPDGTRVCYSVWTSGGYRDIRLEDVRTGLSEEITKDRATESGCSFSSDGRYLFFHSDRTGVFNVFAHDLRTRELSQVTNVVSGAFYPELSPDGKTLAYIGYSKDGYDLFAMDFDAKRFTKADPYVDNHPTAKVVKRRGPYEIKPYNPLHTLAPRRYSAQYTQGAFGQMAVISAQASDIAGLHNIAGTFYSEFDRPDIQGNLSYTYEGLPFDVGVSTFRSIAPRTFDVGNKEVQAPVETLGAATSLSFSKARMFDSQKFSLSYAFSRTGVNVPRGEGIDPFATSTRPNRGVNGTIAASYSYSNAESFLWSVGPERGLTFSLDLNATHPALGSDYTGFSARGNASGYIPMPWNFRGFRHHVLALNMSGGMSAGNNPGRGQFFVGGFSDLPIIDTIRNVLVQGGVVLRGYEAGKLSGNYFLLGNLEYRFPIVNIDWGPSSLPIFFNRINGNAYLDYGSAFDVLKDSKFKTGVGGEIWLDMTLGYFLSLTFRAGYMQGLASEGIDKLYFVAAVPY
jgi:WD40-like Beta Propeller Repeat